MAATYLFSFFLKKEKKSVSVSFPPHVVGKRGGENTKKWNGKKNKQLGERVFNFDQFYLLLGVATITINISLQDGDTRNEKMNCF